MLALGLAEHILNGRGAVHSRRRLGGSIQCFVPVELAAEFCQRMDAWLGEGSCSTYAITEDGASATWL